MLNHFRQILPRTIRPTMMLSNVRYNTNNLEKTPIKANVKSGAWKLGKLSRLAIVVPNLDEASSFFKNVLHAKSVTGAVPQKDLGIYTVHVDFGNTKIELVHPLGDSSPVKKFLSKHTSGGIHHICIEVDNLEEALKEVQQQNIRVLTEKIEPDAQGKSAIFLDPKDCSGVLIKLEQA